MGICWLMLKVLLIICLPICLICVRGGFSWSLGYITQVFYQARGSKADIQYTPWVKMTENGWVTSHQTPNFEHRHQLSYSGSKKHLWLGTKLAERSKIISVRSTELQNQVLKQLEVLTPWEKLICDPESVSGWNGSFPELAMDAGAR